MEDCRWYDEICFEYEVCLYFTLVFFCYELTCELRWYGLCYFRAQLDYWLRYIHDMPDRKAWKAYLLAERRLICVKKRDSVQEKMVLGLSEYEGCASMRIQSTSQTKFFLDF